MVEKLNLIWIHMHSIKWSFFYFSFAPLEDCRLYNKEEAVNQKSASEIWHIGLRLISKNAQTFHVNIDGKKKGN